VSVEIIQFIRGPKHDREQSDFPTIVFRSAARPNDLAMDHVDTSPCEYFRESSMRSGIIKFSQHAPGDKIAPELGRQSRPVLRR
jgi:hypothetical protein